LDLFVPFLTPLIGRFDCSFWTFRLELCDLLCSLIVTKFEKLQIASDFAASLNRNITVIIADSPPEITADFLRYSLQINKIWLPELPPETAAKRLTNLIRAAPTGSLVHDPVIKFAISWISSNIITCDAIATVLVAQDLTRTNDLETLAHLATRPNSNAQLTVVKYLSRVMILNALYGRTAASLLYSVLKKIPAERPLVSWVNHFVRRITIFVSLAFGKNRYLGRIARIAESLAMPAGDAIDWLRGTIETNITALCRTNGAPRYWGDMFVIEVDGQLSEKWKTELESFKNDRVNLKCFPFEPVGLDLCELESSVSQKKKKKGKKKPKKANGKNEPPSKPDEAEQPKRRGRRPKWQS
jgi:hypothetical protein